MNNIKKSFTGCVYWVVAFAATPLFSHSSVSNEPNKQVLVSV